MSHSLTSADSFLISSHGGDADVTDWNNDTDVQIRGNEWETQAVIIPISLKGAITADTDRQFVIIVYWKDSSVIKFQTIWHFYCQELSNQWYVKTYSYEKEGVTDSDFVEIYPRLNAHTLFLQSKITAEDDGNVGCESFVSNSLCFFASNGASKGDFLGLASNIDEVEVGIISYSTNDEEGTMLMMPPYLTESRSGSAAIVANPFNVSDRSLGTTLTFSGDPDDFDYINSNVVGMDMLPADWYAGILNSDLITVTSHITTHSDKFGDIDDDDGEIDWDELKFFQKIKRIRDRVLSVFNNLGTGDNAKTFVNDVLYRIVSNLVTDAPGDKNYMTTIFEWFGAVFVVPWLQEIQIDDISEWLVDLE